MRNIPDKISGRIDNEIYDTDGDQWWKPQYFFNLLATVINPVRVDYARKKIKNVFNETPEKLKVLDVGCGGGLLSEEFARMGFITSGIDPSEVSLDTAIQHARESNLSIEYLKGTGEKIPFHSGSFDIVLCCDVLEHVSDLPKVISEISRVLRKDGIFIYDTFNRTFLSKLVCIKILQEWKRWAIMPPHLHVWKMFIKPQELRSLLTENQLSWKEHTGIRPNIPYLQIMANLRRKAAGKISYEVFGKKFRLVESRKTLVMYMGYAVKNS